MAFWPLCDFWTTLCDILDHLTWLFGPHAIQKLRSYSPIIVYLYFGLKIWILFNMNIEYFLKFCIISEILYNFRKFIIWIVWKALENRCVWWWFLSSAEDPYSSVSYTWAKIYQFGDTDTITEWNMTYFSQNVKFNNLTVHQSFIDIERLVECVASRHLSLRVETDIKKTWFIFLSESNVSLCAGHREKWRSKVQKVQYGQ